MFNTNLNNGFNFIFAKQFNNLYLGTDISGNFNTYFEDNDFTNDKIGTDSKLVSSKIGGNATVLFGFNDMGVGVNFSFSPYYAKETNNEFNDLSFAANAQWGGSFGSDKFVVKPLVTFNYSYFGRKITPKQNYIKDNTFILSLGTDFLSNKATNLCLTLSMSNNINFSFSKEYDVNDNVNIIKLSPSDILRLLYKVSYKFNEKIELGGKITIENGLHYEKYLDSNDNNCRNDLAYFLDGSLNFGIKYNVRPSIFSIMAGTSLSTPAFFSTSITYDIGLESEKSEKKIGSHGGFVASIFTGFEWNITKNLLFDTSMKIPIMSNHKNKDITYSRYIPAVYDDKGKEIKPAYIIDETINVCTSSAFNELIDSISIGITYRK